MRESSLETLNNFTSLMEAAMKEACSALAQAADDMAYFYNSHHKDTPLYEVRSETRSFEKMPTGSNYLHSLAELTQSFGHPIVALQYRCHYQMSTKQLATSYSP